MKNRYSIFLIFFTLCFTLQDCQKKKNKFVLTPLSSNDIDKTVKEKSNMDYRVLDCDSIKKEFKQISLLIGEKFENQLLEYYKCLNTQNNGKYQKQVDLLSQYTGMSNEGSVIFARDTSRRFKMLNQKFEVLQEGRYIWPFHKNISFVDVDSSYVLEFYSYDYEKPEYIRRRYSVYHKMINKKGEVVSNEPYNGFGYANNFDLVRVEKIGKKGIIDFKGKIIIPIKYHEIGIIKKDSTFTVRLKQKWAVKHLNGKLLTNFKYDSESKARHAYEETK